MAEDDIVEPTPQPNPVDMQPKPAVSHLARLIP